jgi:hypothetical protein
VHDAPEILIYIAKAGLHRKQRSKILSVAVSTGCMIKNSFRKRRVRTFKSWHFLVGGAGQWAWDQANVQLSTSIVLLSETALAATTEENFNNHCRINSTFQVSYTPAALPLYSLLLNCSYECFHCTA